MSEQKKSNAKNPFKTILTADFLKKISEITLENNRDYESQFFASSEVIVKNILSYAPEGAVNGNFACESSCILRKGQAERITSALESVGYAVKIEEHPWGGEYLVITVNWGGDEEK